MLMRWRLQWLLNDFFRMEIFIGILAVLAGVIGILGSILPALPGPPLTWVGLLLLYFWGGNDSSGESMSLTLLLVMLGVTVAVSIIDYVVPLYFTKLTGGTKFAGRGAMAGLIFGLFVVPPVGMILGSFLGAFIAELYYARKRTGEALKSAFGSFLGFLAGTGLKLIACGVMMYYIIVYL